MHSDAPAQRIAAVLRHLCIQQLQKRRHLAALKYLVFGVFSADKLAPTIWLVLQEIDQTGNGDTKVFFGELLRKLNRFTSAWSAAGNQLGLNVRNHIEVLSAHEKSCLGPTQCHADEGLKGKFSSLAAMVKQGGMAPPKKDSYCLAASSMWAIRLLRLLPS